ncbi:AtuA-related protein [Geobacillus jurassicus]
MSIGKSSGCFRFVCQHALDGGVTASLALDPHGKTLSYALLEMEL